MTSVDRMESTKILSYSPVYTFQGADHLLWGTFCRIEITDSNPVFCNLIRFVPIFDFQPLSLMNCPENVPANLIHTMLRPVLHDISIIHYDVRTEPLSSKSSIPLLLKGLLLVSKNWLLSMRARFCRCTYCSAGFLHFLFPVPVCSPQNILFCGNRICIRSYKHRWFIRIIFGFHDIPPTFLLVCPFFILSTRK